MPEDTERAVGTALAAGYRHIDTVAAYGNEVETGHAIADSCVPREDVFLVTKLANADHGYDNTLSAFDASVDRLGVDYLDIYLIHWPLPEQNAFVDTFKASRTCTIRAASGPSASATSSRSICGF